VRHSEPRIQELAEAIQGALFLVSDHRIVWTAECDGFAGWSITCKVLPGIGSDQAWSCELAISISALRENQYWDNFKLGIVRQMMIKLADAKPAEEKDVTWLAAPWIEPPEV
jgi:hypothetical protein